MDFCVLIWDYWVYSVSSCGICAPARNYHVHGQPDSDCGFALVCLRISWNKFSDALPDLSFRGNDSLVIR